MSVRSAQEHGDSSWFGACVQLPRTWWRRLREDGTAAEGGEEEDADVSICVKIRDSKGEKSNMVHTTKYEWYNFLGLATLLQFRRFSNAFFLLVVIINSIGYFIPSLYEVSYVPWGTLSILIFVILVTLLFEGNDDLSRRRADKETNNKRATKVTADDTLKECAWGSLEPGDVIRIEKGEFVPADMLIIATSSSEGLCYIETSGIDGETNLKIRSQPHGMEKLKISGASVSGTIQCDPPSPVLQFSGSLHLDNHEPLGLSFNSLLLRGSQLRNTAWVEGIVVYAGEDTKLVLSSSETPSKFSRLDVAVNRIMGAMLIAYILVVVTATLLLLFWAPDTTDLWYFQGLDNINSYELPGWLAYLLTFSGTFASMIPINMYVCLEIVNFMQAKYISWDLNIYHQDTDTRAKCHTGSLTAEIGQVTHIFTDKTGTLTNNEMRLVSVSTAGQLYGWQPPAVDKNSTKSSDESALRPPDKPVPELFKELAGVTFKKDGASQGDEQQQQQQQEKPTNNDSLQEKFLLALALCHTVVTDKDDQGEVQYNAEGPDEEALVSAAAQIGVKLESTSAGVYTLQIGDATRKFNILGVNKFSSARKRMSIVAQEENADNAIVYVKGADNIVLERCTNNEGNATGDTHQAEIEEHLETFSMSGLRTLVVAARQLSSAELKEWQEAHDAAELKTGSERKESSARAAELVETGLNVLGVTGIEDALQDGVPETIQMIRDASIALWVLTGDKIETAINIAFSARIIDGQMTKITLDSHSQDELLSQMKQVRTALESVQRQIDEASPGSENDETQQVVDLETGTGEEVSHVSIDASADLASHLALVVSGSALSQLLTAEKGTKASQEELLALASSCSVVLACRVSPSQKALVVEMVETSDEVRKHHEPVTLSIGDGANDVAMIQQARVGVGISGHEGLQAVNSADFSIARFRFLQDLLFVHGRWNYFRNTLLVKYICLSWLVPILMVFVYLFYSAVSAQSIYVNTYYLTMWAWVTNSVITAIAWFQKDISRATMLRNPSTYDLGRLNSHMTLSQILKLAGRTTLHVALLLCLVFLTVPSTISLDALGITICTGAFTVMFARQINVTTDVNLFLLVCFSLCFLLFIVGTVAIDTFTGDGISLLFASEVAQLVWARALLVFGSLIVLEYILYGLPRIAKPDKMQIVRESDRVKGAQKLRQHKGSHVPVSAETTQSGNQMQAEKPHRERTQQLIRDASSRLLHVDSLSAHRGFAQDF